MNIMCNSGIMCTAEQLVIMAANTDDFNDVIDYVMCELEGYNEEHPPHALSGVELCTAMFKMGITSRTAWRIPQLDRELLDILLDRADEVCGDVDMVHLIEVYVSSMLMSGQWSYPL